MELKKLILCSQMRSLKPSEAAAFHTALRDWKMLNTGSFFLLCWAKPYETFDNYKEPECSVMGDRRSSTYEKALCHFFFWSDRSDFPSKAYSGVYTKDHISLQTRFTRSSAINPILCLPSPSKTTNSERNSSRIVLHEWLIRRWSTFVKPPLKRGHD
jgi:hypothetical protein